LIAVSTLRRVSSETPTTPRMTFETVDLDTPARDATSRIVGDLRTGVEPS